MSIRNIPIPTWKNSPIKTAPSELRRVQIPMPNKKHNPIRAKLGSKQPINSDEMEKIVKDTSTMFDDDEDHVKIASPIKRDSVSQSIPIPVAPTPNSQMQMMFSSPDVSMSMTNENAEFLTSKLFQEEQNEEELEEEVQSLASIQLEQVHNTSPESTTIKPYFDLPTLLQKATEQTTELANEETKPFFDLHRELEYNPDLAEHIQFLTDFDYEFNSHQYSSTSNKKDNKSQEMDKEDYKKILLKKLESYVNLPDKVLQNIINKQHEELVSEGLFNEHIPTNSEEK